MTDLKNINRQYNQIVDQLQILIPKIKLDEIKKDVDEFLYSSLIDEIQFRDFSIDLSYYKIKRDIIKQKLQSSRQPLKLRDKKDENENFFI
ncbi:MAG: hypothetical protein ACTSQJ_03760 [Promethearchaeota archaeon]